MNPSSAGCYVLLLGLSTTHDVSDLETKTIELHWYDRFSSELTVVNYVQHIKPRRLRQENDGITGNLTFVEEQVT